ncbi:RNA pseudouridine synthase, partial [Clostridium perfringens]
MTEEMPQMDMDDESVLEWTADAESAKDRIDKYVKAQMGEDTSRSQIQLWIEDGNLTVNGSPVKANYKIAAGDLIVLRIPEAEATEIVPEDIPLEVYYEDSDVIVLNKKRGMVVHPAPGHASGTLVNAMMYHCKYVS